MPSQFKVQFDRFWLLALGAYLLVLASISLTAYQHRLPKALDAIPYYDTIGHFVLLGLASGLGHLAVSRQHIHLGQQRLPLAPTVIVVLMLVEEGLQTLSPYRTFSLVDIVANLLGIACFYGLAERSPLGKRHR